MRLIPHHLQLYRLTRDRLHGLESAVLLILQVDQIGTYPFIRPRRQPGSRCGAFDELVGPTLFHGQVTRFLRQNSLNSPTSQTAPLKYKQPTRQSRR